jgi:hypothetical protein
LANITPNGKYKDKRFHHGFIAQDIQSLIKDGVIEDFGGFSDGAFDGEGEDIMSLGYHEFIAPLVKAVQELTVRVKELESKTGG